MPTSGRRLIDDQHELRERLVVGHATRGPHEPRNVRFEARGQLLRLTISRQESEYVPAAAANERFATLFGKQLRRDAAPVSLRRSRSALTNHQSARTVASSVPLRAGFPKINMPPSAAHRSDVASRPASMTSRARPSANRYLNASRADSGDPLLWAISATSVLSGDQRSDVLMGASISSTPPATTSPSAVTIASRCISCPACSSGRPA